MPTMAKNIKDAITETEKNKNNLTQAKIKIDNKLVSLGGQSAINLNDTPNKIEQMVNTQFKKIATGEFSFSCYTRGGIDESDTVDLSNVNFNIKRVILLIDYCDRADRNLIGVVDTNKLPDGKGKNITHVGTMSSDKYDIKIEKAVWKSNKIIELFPVSEYIGATMYYKGKYIAIG